jgi:hypothetical protein
MKLQNRRTGMGKATKIFVILEISLILIVVSYVYFTKRPAMIYPADGMLIRELNFNFEVENADEIILSKEKSFEDPIVLADSREITLPPGVYFWKAKNILGSSGVRNFSVQSHVILNLEKGVEFYELRNAGDVALNLSYENCSSCEKKALDIGELFNLALNDTNKTYEGKQA